MTMVLCSQCEQRRPFYKINGHPLCIFCYQQVQQVEQLDFCRNATLLNCCLDMFGAQAGIQMPRMQVPQPTIGVGQVIQHNVNVDRSVVGTINTGRIENLRVALSDIRQGGDAATADVMEQFASAVVSANDADNAIKNELLEHLACLSDQLAKSPTERSPSVMKTVLGGIKSVATTVASLSELFDVFEKHLNL